MDSAFVCATYRLQLTPSFGFDAAAGVVPYLRELGITHLYLSPILESAAGSTHGYDVIDHSRISGALGGRDGYDRLVATARAHDLGVIVDIVPNHMSIADRRNQWWWDVLENGPSAQAAFAFDVDWRSPEQKLKNVLLVPVLGDHRSDVLDRGEIQVKREGARFTVVYTDHVYPVAPRTLGELLLAATRFSDSTRLRFLADVYTELPAPTALDRLSVARRHRDRVELTKLLADLVAVDHSVAAAIDRAVGELNGDPEALDAFLDRQNYRLAHWRSAQHDVDYRRFFDINSLVGLRVEDPLVFERTHELVCELRRDGKLDGVRVDHVDGLSDPAAYLDRLRAALGPVPIYVEKILAADEELRAWPIQGTTGYDFLNDLTQTFLDPTAGPKLDALGVELVGPQPPFADQAAEARIEVLQETLASDVTRLTTLLHDICDQHRDARDYTRHDLELALRALLASFPVYRTYVVPGRDVDARDLEVIRAAAALAAKRTPNVDERLFRFIVEILSCERTGEREAELVRRFQQLTPPALAKGLEDTAFYRDCRLLALDEVGGDPSRFTMSLEEFHARDRRAMERWPERMLATSTHDTKRSEDVRARVVAITEAADDYAALARAFFSAAQRHRTGDVPEPYVMMIVLQTLIGAWPIDAARLSAFVEKSIREAKRTTSWSRPDERYEAACKRFAESLLADPAITELIASYVEKHALASRSVALAWTLLKCTCPGVPDIYQGNELERLDLVDPDNRRTIDWAGCAQAMKGSLPSLADDEHGLRKLDVLRRVLRHRRQSPHVFDRHSTYEPLAVSGEGREHVIAFARRAPNGDTTIVVAVRWSTRFRADRATLTLPSGPFTDLLRDAPASAGSLAELLGGSPIGLFHARAR